MTRFPTAAISPPGAACVPGAMDGLASAATSAPSPATMAATRVDRVARAAVRTKGTYFGAQYRQIARRRDQEAVAVAHSLIELVWHLLSTGEWGVSEEPCKRGRKDWSCLRLRVSTVMF